MPAQPLIDSLYAYNDWANQQVLSLAADLSDGQLDAPRPMGFGTLRATLFHILAADTIWLERWQGVPWRPFPMDPQGMSRAAMAEQLAEVAQRRRQLVDAERGEGWQRIVDYRDSKQTPYQHQLRDLLLHVFHHGVHHRAQALNYLKHFGRQVAWGIDYPLYRLASGAETQSAAAVELLQAHGLSPSATPAPPLQWEPQHVQRLLEYHRWANQRVLQAAAQLSDTQLDQAFPIGHGSLRKILTHMLDVEAWWLDNWTAQPRPRTASDTRANETAAGDTARGIADLAARWQTVAQQSDAYLANLNGEQAARVLEVPVRGVELRIAIADSAVHVVCHGTHHRAQLVNLFRQVGAPVGNIDLLYALAELTPPPPAECEDQR